MFVAANEDGDAKVYRPYSSIYNNLLEKRKIFLIGELDREISSHIVSLLIYLNEKDKKDIITLYINSGGGDIQEGMYAIYDTMQMIEAPVETICLGEAASAGAILLASGSKGLRKATCSSSIMIHQIQVEGIEGSGTHVAREMKEIKSLNKRIIETLASHCNQPYKKVYRDCKNDKYFTAEQAKKYGIIDSIITPSKILDKQKVNKSALVSE